MVWSTNLFQKWNHPLQVSGAFLSAATRIFVEVGEECILIAKASPVNVQIFPILVAMNEKGKKTTLLRSEKFARRDGQGMRVYPTGYES